MGVGLCAFASDKKTLDIQNRGIVETVFLSVILFFFVDAKDDAFEQNESIKKRGRALRGTKSRGYLLLYFYFFIFSLFFYFFIHLT